MSVAFATVPELADALQRDIPADDGPANQALILSSAAIQAAMGQHVAYAADDVVTLEPERGGNLWLPERPVLAVASVAVGATTLPAADYWWTRDGELGLATGTPWWSAWWTGTGPVMVTVTYSHGYEVIPDEIKAVCLAAAGRQLANPDGIVREQTATYSVTYASGSAGIGVGVTLTEAEKQLLPRRLLVA